MCRLQNVFSSTFDRELEKEINPLAYDYSVENLSRNMIPFSVQHPIMKVNKNLNKFNRIS